MGRPPRGSRWTGSNASLSGWLSPAGCRCLERSPPFGRWESNSAYAAIRAADLAPRTGRPLGSRPRASLICWPLTSSPAMIAVSRRSLAADDSARTALASWLCDRSQADCCTPSRSSSLPTYVLFKPNERGEFINRNAWHVDGILNGACVSVAYRHATEHYLAIVDG
jgi:hypothetical protein